MIGPHFEPYASELFSNKNFIKYKSHIKIWGSRKDAFKLIYSADLFLFPTRAEAFPRVILECMVLKTPIISTNVDGITEMIENNTSGLLFCPSKKNELINALNKMINNKHLSLKLTKNASERYWNLFTRKKQINNFRLFFKKISN